MTLIGRDFVTNQSLYGQGSVKLYVTAYSDVSAGRIYQDITTLTAGKKYTLSGYVKAESINGNSSLSGAFLAATVFKADNSTQTFQSDYISEVPDAGINNGWRRVSTTFTVPSGTSKVRVNLALRAATGAVYFDGVQLEEAETPGSFTISASGFFAFSNADSVYKLKGSSTQLGGGAGEECGIGGEISWSSNGIVQGSTSIGGGFSYPFDLHGGTSYTSISSSFNLLDPDLNDCIKFAFDLLGRVEQFL